MSKHQQLLFLNSKEGMITWKENRTREPDRENKDEENEKIQKTKMGNIFKITGMIVTMAIVVLVELVLLFSYLFLSSWRMVECAVFKGRLISTYWNIGVVVSSNWYRMRSLQFTSQLVLVVTEQKLIYRPLENNETTLNIFVESRSGRNPQT